MARQIKRFGDIEAHYELIGYIGGGAQGDLYLGQGLETDELVAIKMQRERGSNPNGVSPSSRVNSSEKGLTATWFPRAPAEH
ncbi:hypothetical protein ACIRFF_00350 [Streptomyces cyaneofuscatus]